MLDDQHLLVSVETMQSQANRLPGDIIKQEREAAGITQAELASRVGTKQQTIDKIEAGKIKHSRLFPRIAMELRFDIVKLLPELGTNTNVITESDLRSNQRDFPVHVAAQGGRGELIVSSEPVSWVLRPTPLLGVSKAYGIIIVGESMEPEFWPGDTALINPHLPPERGETFIFYSEKDGEAHATIKRLVKWTQTHWHLRQWNPPTGEKADFTALRRDWPKAHRVVGKYSK